MLGRERPLGSNFIICLYLTVSCFLLISVEGQLAFSLSSSANAFHFYCYLAQNSNQLILSLSAFVSSFLFLFFGR